MGMAGLPMESMTSNFTQLSLKEADEGHLHPLKKCAGYEGSKSDDEKELLLNDQEECDTKRKITLDQSELNTLMNFSNNEEEDENEQIGSKGYFYQRSLSTHTILTNVESTVCYAEANDRQLNSTKTYQEEIHNLTTRRINITSTDYLETTPVLIDSPDST